MRRKAIILILLISLLAVTLFTIKNNIIKQAGNIYISDIEFSSINDGDYTGKYELLPVKALVQVQVKNCEVYEIKILEHQNGLGEKAEKINDQVIEKQSLQVDLVSGATVSSKVILKAIENALSK